MKHFWIIAFGFLLCAANLAKAQKKDCPMPCAQEEFPFVFCVNGVEIEQCSSDPSTEGGDLVKAFLPNCIHVDQTSQSGVLTGMPPVGKAQVESGSPVPGPEPPDTCGADPFPGPIDPPDKESIWEYYISYTPPPWTAPFYASQANEDIWLDDITVYDAANTQWTLDSSNFFDGLGWELTDTSGMDPDAAQTAVNYYSSDYYGLFREYNIE